MPRARPSRASRTQPLRVYDSPFSVRLNTQEMTRAGKLKEGFDIPVFDSDTSKSNSIRKLSGGEVTIVEDAVAKAICIYNKTSNGETSRPSTRTEKWSARPEKNRSYFRLKHKVLRSGDTIRNSHHPYPELLAMANAVISLKPGGIAITANN